MRQEKPLHAYRQALAHLTTMIYLGKPDIEGCPNRLYVRTV